MHCNLIARTLLPLLLLAASCSIPPEEIPEGILSKDSMEMILYDIYLTEGARMSGRKMYDTGEIGDYYRLIYTKFEIDEKRFNRSYHFYSTYPDLMLDVHDKLIRRLNEEDARMTSGTENQKKRVTVPNYNEEQREPIGKWIRLNKE